LEVMMRPAEVFVRWLSHDEAVRLKWLSTRAKHQPTRIRAAILLASNVQMSVPEIARMWLTDDSHVRKVIHEFNERGFDSLDPKYRGGRPRRITPVQRQRVVAVAGARPDRQGVPLTRWSLDRLAVWLGEQGIVEISPAHLARLLADAGLSFQRTRSWKASPDPDYQARAERVLALYAAPAPDGPVISFDQMGPISLRPTHGAGWAARTRPERLRATYNRRHGVRYIFGALDVHADRLRARMRPRRSGAETLWFLRTIRHSYRSRQRIYWVQDNLSANWTPGHPRLRRRQPRRARAHTHLRQLPQPHREPLPPDSGARVQQHRLPRLGRGRSRPRRARRPPQRARPQPAHRRARTPPPHRRLTCRFRSNVPGRPTREGSFVRSDGSSRR
jgi:transposase